MTTTETPASCSFCLKPYTDVRVLVFGPGVYICDECVALSSQLIADRPVPDPTAPVAHVAPWEAETGLDSVLASLPRMARAKSQAEHVLTQYVRRARQLGASWAAVGGALGITRQSAWERFSKVE